MFQTISVIGSTGSVGRQTLEVARHLGIRVTALAAHSHAELLAQQIREFRPGLVCVFSEAAAVRLRELIPEGGFRLVTGLDGLCEVSVAADAEAVLSSAVGAVGLVPTLEAVRAGKPVALANKESLVVGGSLIMPLARQKNVPILPVDSEHSAIFQSLAGCQDKKEIDSLLLTASGGPFFGYTREEMGKITPEDALRHPTWKMGPKITIDCATLMNKGLEIIEASWLFDVPIDQIEVVVHRESIIHSAVRYTDGSCIAQLSVPDMRLAIQYALTYPERKPGLTPRLSLRDVGKLSFYEPDAESFRCLKLAIQAGKRGGTACAVLNAANEVAVAQFLAGNLRFSDIDRLVACVLSRLPVVDDPTLEQILSTDAAAREAALELSRQPSELESF